jgi:type II secretory ATPase GspE/PulE/Tfp pilus assembly ATPase PilB-like protein
MYAVTGFFAVPLSGRFDFAHHGLSFSAFVSSPVIAQQGIALPFSITKLLILIGWVYACLYTIQRLQFTPLVPARAKTIVNITGLFLGPILFLLLLITDSIFNYSGIETGFVGRIKESVQRTISGLKSLEAPLTRHTREIILLHSSGREIGEVFGGDKIAKQDRHILKLTDQIIYDALAEQASDILIDPKDDSTYSVRLRVDGMLRTIQQLDFDKCQAVINSIKAVAGMDISEKRRPQDGAFTAKAAERSFSFRVASAGVMHGEKLSIRVLNYNAASLRLENVGLSDKQIAIIRDYLKKPSGMILLCGPTGCGKTTTLYTMLNEIDHFTHNVITVEDPIECVLPNASQIEVNPRADITFAKSLRSILRQDPDVICVGEIRDEETASIALRASQTGHLVLATIHSYSNASALCRLIDLSVSPMLISSGLNLLVSQRLVRKLCEYCRQPAKLRPEQIESFRNKNIDCSNIYTAGGCDLCNSTGYKGRTAISDIIVIDTKLKESIANNKLPIEEMKTEGNKRGISNLRKEGLRKVLSGITSLEELQRVIG